MKKLLFLVIFLTACTSTSQVCFEDSCFEVEIADSIPEQSKGLMFRESLDENKGMLFIYQEERELAFWMKNTLISLDIIFIDANNKVTQINQADPCKKDLCQTYKGYGKYVLELNQGASDNIELEVGDTLTI